MIDYLCNTMSMEVETILMCRACMKIDGKFLSIYGDDMEQKNLSDKLADLTDIQITEEDGLPTVLCPKCAYRTHAFHEFKNQVRNSHEKLSKMFQNPTIQNQLITQNSPSEEENLEDHTEIISQIDEDPSIDIKENFDSPNPESNTEEFPLKTEETEEEIKIISEIDELDSVENINEFLTAPFSIDKRELVNKDEISPELQEILNSEDTGYTFLYIPSDQIEFALNEDTDTESNEKEFNIITQVTSSIQSESSEEIDKKNSTDNYEEIDDSDSDDCTEQSGNVVGSVNDTVVKIKEIKTDSGITEYQCTLCMENYGELSDVLIHTVENHIPSTGPFFCVVCEKDCESQKDLRSHVKTHTGTSPYSCFICDKAYTTKRYLKRHMVCHTDFSRYRCAKCGKRFKVKSDLEMHATSHLHGAPYSCSQCKRIFNHKGNYKRHLISHLDPQGLRLPKYPCEICGKRFLNNRTLQTHMRVHTGEKPYPCKVCGRSFSQQGNLLNHMRIHSNPRSYTCEVCGKRFNQRATLKDHSLLHTGEKPYVCNICGTAFTFSAALRRHMWVHADDKPLGCNICEARFVGRYDLNRHMKIHSDKPRKRKPKTRRLRRESSNRDDSETAIVDQGTSIETPFEEILINEDEIHIVRQKESEKENVDALFRLIQY